MINIIYGKSRCGKSEYLYEIVKEKYMVNIENNINSYLIVPEQFSLSAQERITDYLKMNGLFNVEVLSFNRLAHLVLSNLGINVDFIDDIGKKVILYNVLKEANFSTFNSVNKGNIENIVNIFDEFVRYNASIEEMSKVQFDNIKSEKKMKDLISIYENYLYSIKQNGKVVSNNLSLLLEHFDECDMFKNCDIYIDEFYGYTQQEYDIIARLAKHNNVTITFCIDNEQFKNENILDIYYSNKKEYIRFRDYCSKNNIVIGSIKKIEDKISKNYELKHLSDNIFNYPYIKYLEQSQCINIFACSNVYTEVENLAIQISKDIKNGMKYNEIAVITRDIPRYDDLIWAIFKKYNIPYYLDEKMDINNNQISQLIFSLLNIIIENFSYESIFAYLKTGFLDIDIDDIFLLENYVVKWGIKGYKWFNKFKYGMNDEYKEIIEKLNVLREKIIIPLQIFKEKVDKSKTVNEYIKILYSFLEDNNIQKSISNRIYELKENNLHDLEAEYINIWNYYIKSFKQLDISLQNVSMTVVEFKNVLEIALTSMQKGNVPLFKDAVIIGDIERTRINKLKSIYFIGTQNDKFPIVYSNEGIISDNEREILKDNNVTLAKTTSQKMLEDQFNIYKMITMAQNKVVFSFVQNDLNGVSYRPSLIINKVKNIFNISEVIVDNEYIYNNSRDICNANFIHLFDNITLLKWYQMYKNKDYQKFIDILNYDIKMDITLLEENCNSIYGKEINTSISKIEKYAKCPYSFYLQYGLYIKENEKYKVRSLDIGNFNHEVLDRFFKEIANRKINFSDLENEQCKQITLDIIEAVFSDLKVEMIKNAKEFIVLKRKLIRVLQKSIWVLVLQIKNSSFRPVGTEIEFGNKENELVIEMDNGRKIHLRGKIDRIDIADTTKRRYVRIIDYKSSNKNVDISDIYNGLNIQLITYLDAVTAKEDLIPGGILYFKIHDPIIRGKSIPDEELESKIMNEMRLKGLVLKDDDLLHCMDNNMVTTSTLINIKINKDGTTSNKNTVDLNQFKKLQKDANNILKKIANSIMSGNINIYPYWKKKTDNGCTYCPYNSICKFNAKDSKCKYNILQNVEL